MSWATLAAAGAHVTTGEGAELTLQGEAAGASSRTYSNAVEGETIFRGFQDGSLRTTALRRFYVPRTGDKPARGEHATYDGGSAGVVRSVTQEAGTWTVEVG